MSAREPYPTNYPATQEGDFALFDEPNPDLDTYEGNLGALFFGGHNPDLDNADDAETRIPRPTSPTSSDDSTVTIHPVPASDWRFNIPSVERRDLMGRLRSVLSVWAQPIEFWACLQVCEIIKLSWIVDIAAVSSDAFEHLAFKFVHLPSSWMRRWNGRTASTDPRTLSARHAALWARRAARRRDGRRCMLTGSRTDIKVLEFCPPNLGLSARVPSEPSIWRLLDFLWDRDTVSDWHAALFPYGDSSTQVQGTSNMMCLRADLCKLYRKGIIGFYPLWTSDEEGTSVQHFEVMQEEEQEGEQYEEEEEVEAHDFDLATFERQW